MKRKEYVQLCPICASKDFSLYNANREADIASEEQYICNRCKNVFSFPYETTKDNAKKIRPAKLTKEILTDTPESAYDPVGRFEIGFYWKILGATMVFTGVASSIFNPTNTL